jgi:hypothetical protein
MVLMYDAGEREVGDVDGNVLCVFLIEVTSHRMGFREAMLTLTLPMEVLNAGVRGTSRGSSWLVPSQRFCFVSAQ